MIGECQLLNKCLTRLAKQYTTVRVILLYIIPVTLSTSPISVFWVSILNCVSSLSLSLSSPLVCFRWSSVGCSLINSTAIWAPNLWVKNCTTSCRFCAGHILQVYTPLEKSLGRGKVALLTQLRNLATACVANTVYRQWYQILHTACLK